MYLPLAGHGGMRQRPLRRVAEPGQRIDELLDAARGDVARAARGGGIAGSDEVIAVIAPAFTVAVAVACRCPGGR